ncbi:uncharacterized protein LOC143218546 [Lasioglossum baleicum]|uniref:uncharacterized protein LOC143218546 n=1 Tax=Lasioglossum baleicum TaxID=434251 RepID=UPI003FCDE079
MPRCCCVPNCKGNYDSTLKANNYISIFKFTKDEQLRKKWMAAIPRKNWTPIKYSAVCSLHYAETDIQRYQNILSPNGVLENVLFRCPKRMENAIPSIFSNSPSKRLINNYKEKLVISNHWSIKITNSKIYFCMLLCSDTSDFLVLKTQIVINDDMKLQVFQDGNELLLLKLEGCCCSLASRASQVGLS